MARLSSICGAARRLENLVDYWLQKSHWQKASRDFAHSRRRTRMVWENRVASLTADEFKCTYRMSASTFNFVLERILQNGKNGNGHWWSFALFRLMSGNLKSNII